MKQPPTSKAEYEFPQCSINFVATLTSKPKVTLFIGLLLIGFTLFGLTRLTADFTHAGYFHKSDKWLVEFEKFEQTFGNDDSIIIAVRNKKGIFNQASLELLDELTSEVWKLPDIIRVDSLTNYQRIFAEGDDINVESLFSSKKSYSESQINELKEVALKDEMLSGYLLSGDTTMTLIVGTLRPSEGDTLDIKPVVNATRALLEQIKTKGHELHLVGAPLIVQSFAEASETDNAKIIPLLLLACILIMYYVLRNVGCVVYAMLVVVVSAVGSLGIAGWLGVQMTSITTILPQITLGIAVAGCLHILTVYRLSQTIQPNKISAIEYALVKNVKPTLLTAITTSIGFLSFYLSEIKTISDLGLVASISVFYVWCLTYLLLAPLLLILPLGYNNKRPLIGPHSLLQKLVNNIAKNKLYILGLYTAFIFVSVVGATMVHVDADPIGYFSQDHELRKGVEQIDKHIGSARNIEIMIDSGCENCAQKPEFLTKVAELEAFIENRPGVSQVISIVDILKSTNRALNFGDEASYEVATTQTEIAQQLLFYTMGLPKGLSMDNRISSKQDSLRLTVFWTIGSSSKALDEIALIEQESRHLGLNATVTGKYSLYQRQESYVVNSFLSSVGIAFLLITSVLCIAFKSLKLSVVALLPNLTPLLVGGLGLWLMGENLNVGTVLVVSITLGIAVDDTLHIITEYQRQKQKGLTSNQAFKEVLTETGVALYGTTLVLVFAFGSSMISSFAPFQIFGALASIVLIAALAIDLTVLPAIMLPKKTSIHAAPEGTFTTSHQQN